jgi:hypothetical protein
MARGRECEAMIVSSPIRPLIVSVEALSRIDSVAARDRYWLDIPARLGSTTKLHLSDLMPIRPVADLPVDLREAAKHALPATTMAPEDEIGLYWEVYGLDPDWNSVEFSLTVERVGRGFFRRVGEWTGLVGKRTDRISMQWTEGVPAAISLNRAITVRLTPSMDGSYAIRLEVKAPNGEVAATTRLIEVQQP